MEKSRLISKPSILSVNRGARSIAAQHTLLVCEQRNGRATKDNSKRRRFGNKSRGFTLIEVLVAVAILGIALIAVMRTAQQAIKSTSYIQSKMTADFVASDTMARVRAGLITLPIAGGKQTGNLQMLGQDWQWQVNLDTLIGLNIDKITVTVQQQDRTFLSLNAYVAVDSKGVPILPGSNNPS